MASLFAALFALWPHPVHGDRAARSKTPAKTQAIARSKAGSGGASSSSSKREKARLAEAEADTLAAGGPAPQVKEWLTARGRQCTRDAKRKGQWYCQGPRRVARPFGPDAARAEQLGLGTLRAAGDLIFTPPKPEWQEAAGPERGELLLWPVADGKLWRGLESARRTATVFKPRHKGLDIGAKPGTPIRAAKSGIVAYADNEVRGYGNLLITIHGDGSVAFYGHCRAIYVFAGQRIEQGQIVAQVGATGRARGPHLHFEYRLAGRIRNPLKYFSEPVADRRGASPTSPGTRKPGA